MLAKEMLLKISRLRVMNALARDPMFGYANVETTVIEVERDKKYKYHFHFNDEHPELDYEEEVEPETEEEIRELRNMKKKPQNIYSALITKKEENGDKNSNIIVFYDKGSHIEAVMKLTNEIIQSFIDWKGITEIKDLEKYVNASERESEKKFQTEKELEYLFKQGGYKHEQRF
jgi:hypothetical protein